MEIRRFEGERGILLQLFQMADDSERQVNTYLDAGHVIVAADGDAVVG